MVRPAVAGSVRVRIADALGEAVSQRDESPDIRPCIPHQPTRSAVSPARGGPLPARPAAFTPPARGWLLPGPPVSALARPARGRLLPSPPVSALLVKG